MVTQAAKTNNEAVTGTKRCQNERTTKVQQASGKNEQRSRYRHQTARNEPTTKVQPGKRQKRATNPLYFEFRLVLRCVPSVLLRRGSFWALVRCRLRFELPLRAWSCMVQVAGQGHFWSQVTRPCSFAQGPAGKTRTAAPRHQDSSRSAHWLAAKQRSPHRATPIR